MHLQSAASYPKSYQSAIVNFAGRLLPIPTNTLQIDCNRKGESE